MVRGKGSRIKSQLMTTIFNILKLKDRRESLRLGQTPEEVLLWGKIRREQLGFKFRRQHSIGGYITDFYCPQKKLVIEIDGLQHLNKEAKEYDQERTYYFSGLDIKVLRFTNAEINKDINGVILKIQKQLT